MSSMTNIACTQAHSESIGGVKSEFNYLTFTIRTRATPGFIFQAIPP